jgi:hypothetical protein
MCAHKVQSYVDSELAVTRGFTYKARYCARETSAMYSSSTTCPPPPLPPPPPPPRPPPPVTFRAHSPPTVPASPPSVHPTPLLPPVFLRLLLLPSRAQDQVFQPFAVSTTINRLRQAIVTAIMRQRGLTIKDSPAPLYSPRDVKPGAISPWGLGRRAAHNGEWKKRTTAVLSWRNQMGLGSFQKDPAFSTADTSGARPLGDLDRVNDDY